MKKILIVEDDFKVAENYKSRLVQEGYEVKISGDEQALDVIKSEKPDLVLLDILMPKVSGLDILREMKLDPELEMIPVLILTNVEGANELSEAVAFGASGYLVKAETNLDVLASKVKETLEGGAMATGVKG